MSDSSINNSPIDNSENPDSLSREGIGRENNEEIVVGTWGPPKETNMSIKTQPETIAPIPTLPSRSSKLGAPIWTVLVGLGLAILFQVIVGVVFIVIQIASNTTLLTQNPQALTESLNSNGLFIITGIVTLWLGLLIGVWLGGKKTVGGWKALVRWKFVWKVDLPIALAFVLVFRGVEYVVGLILQGFGIDVSNLSNDQVLKSTTGFWLILVLLAAALGAPIVEELFFRGLFLRSVQAKWSTAAAIIVSSFVFGLMHAQATWGATIYTVVSTMIIGVALAILCIKTNRLGTSVLAHILFNSSAVLLTALFVGF